jgi:hypothetical protein
LGQTLRDSLIPFWAFTEVNFRTYINGIRNLAIDNRTSLKAGRSIAKAIGVTAVVKSPFLAMRLGRVALLVYGAQAALTTYNMLRFPDEEEELPDEVRNRPHIVLGRNADGSVRYFDRLGTSTDFLDWMGLDAVDHATRQIISGRMTLTDFAKNMAYSPYNKAVQGASPAIKLFSGLTTGKNTYPDVSDPRTIRDKGEFVSQMLTLDKPYRIAFGRPTKGYGDMLRSMLYYQIDSGEASYYRTKDQIQAFTEKGRLSSDKPTPRAEALYYYRQALRFGDDYAADKYFAEYQREGGTEKTVMQSLRALHPLGSLSVPNEIRFLALLDERGRDDIAKAEKYFYENLITPEQAAEIKKSRANRVKDAVKTVLTKSGRPNPDTNSDYEGAIAEWEADFTDIQDWIQKNGDKPDVRKAIEETVRSERFQTIELGKAPRRRELEPFDEYQDRIRRDRREGKTPEPRKRESEREYQERLRQVREDSAEARRWRKWLVDQNDANR